MAWNKVSDAQWEKIRVHIPRVKPSPLGGRPRVDDRRCFEGILWILWTGAPWSALPRQYGSPTTCWRRLKQWEADGVLLALWRAFLAELNDRDKIRWDECFIDGTFVPARKGGPWSERPSEGRAQSAWFWSMAKVLRWDFTWTRHRPPSASSSSRRSPQSPSTAPTGRGRRGANRTG